MESRHVFILIFILVFLDAVAINFSYALIYLFSSSSSPLSNYSFGVIILFNIAWFLPTVFNKLYTYKAVQTNSTIRDKSIITFAGQIIIIALATANFKNLSIAPAFINSILITQFICLALIRAFIYYIQKYFPALVYYKKKIAIVGYNEASDRLKEYFHQNKLSFKLLGQSEYVNGLSDENQLSRLKADIQYAVKYQLDEVYTPLFHDDKQELAEILKLAEESFVRVRFVTTEVKYKHELDNTAGLRYNLNGYYNGIPVLVDRLEPLYAINNRILKRAFDILFSVFIIIFLLSWLFPLMALLIKLESRGPAIFMQMRSGRNNKPFWCYKFRSMRANANGNKAQAEKNDSRITKIGAFIRKTSIDELPQFFNVLFGDMSIVGPRPHMIEHTDEYREIIDHYMMRLYLKPGITGWAQVNGYRGETKDPILMQKRVEYDLWYIEKWSVFFDIKIVLLTVANVFKGEENAY